MSADIRLASTIAAGDRQAFVALMRRFNGQLYRTARSIVLDDLAAETALERAWLLAYRTIGSFSGETKLSIWLMRIVIAEALAHPRKPARATPQSDRAAPGSSPRETRKHIRSSNVNPA
jgi:RNA polymerase sigma-70 factor, ECF subfamily